MQIEYAELKNNLSFCLKLSDYYIVLKKGLSECEERVCLSHELGHVEYAGLYTEKTPYDTVDRIEHRARKYSYVKLMPLGEVREALKTCSNIYELADHFNVTEPFAAAAVSYYRECANL